MLRIKPLILLSLFLLLPSFCLGASPLEDEFSTDTLSDDWSQFGTGSISISGGELTITVTDSSFTGVSQTVSGDFDVMARLGDADYPNEIPTVRFVALYVYEGSDYAFGYQNFESPGDNNLNEIKSGNTIEGFPYGGTTDWPISEYVCIRIAGSSGFLRVYYNDSGDCSGSWNEEITNPALYLPYTGTVDIKLQARSDGVVPLTYTVDFFRCTSGGCDSVSNSKTSLNGVSLE